MTPKGFWPGGWGAVALAPGWGAVIVAGGEMPLKWVQAEKIIVINKNADNLCLMFMSPCGAVAARQRSALEPQTDRREACRLKARVERRPKHKPMG